MILSHADKKQRYLRPESNYARGGRAGGACFKDANWTTRIEKETLATSGAEILCETSSSFAEQDVNPHFSE